LNNGNQLPKRKNMRALILEDEDLIARELKEKIAIVAGDIEIIEVLPSLKTARKWFLQNAEPDLIFMDIQLSDGISFDIFDHYKITCPVIFTTAYDEYAIRAFKVHGAAYLQKPVDEEELGAAIMHCRKQLQQHESPAADMAGLLQSLNRLSSGKSLYKEKFIASIRNQWMPVNTREIACFAKEVLNYIYVFSGERHMIDFATLDEVEELLDPRQFYRANRQYIINIEAIKIVKPQENSKLTITLKEPLHKLEIDMSREKAPVFKKWLDR
jgi:DNA-binding LytR/AlgR family response regulator